MDMIKNVDLATGLATIALIAVTADHIYFEKKLSTIEQSIKEIKENLSNLILQVHPSTAEKIKQLIENVSILEEKVFKGETENNVEYKRFTKRNDEKKEEIDDDIDFD
ncbi:MAG: hypothetical protein QW478_01465 [Candidatus Micrarchaeaceae archaeon]